MLIVIYFLRCQEARLLSHTCFHFNGGEGCSIKDESTIATSDNRKMYTFEIEKLSSSVRVRAFVC